MNDKISDLKKHAREIDQAILDLRTEKTDFAKLNPNDAVGIADFDIRIMNLVKELAQVRAEIVQLRDSHYGE